MPAGLYRHYCPKETLMQHKLSYHNIFATLAALGATSLVACGGETTPEPETPVGATEVPAAEPAAESAAASEEAPTEAPAPEGTSADGAGEEPKPEDAAATATPAPAPTPAPAAKPAAKKKAGAKHACGAGTCG
jgi:hypothetical protein